MDERAFRERVDRFWLRVTEGMQLDQLWSQFRKDAHSSYRLYSQDVDSTRVAGVPHSKHFFSVASQYFWAIIEKLSPARRVLLLLALVLVLLPGGEWSWTTRAGELKVFALDFHFWGGLLMFALLILEVGDRVVMKRDLQIAKEIQTWLLPAKPPEVPGLEIAFCHAPSQHSRRGLLRRVRPPAPRFGEHYVSHCHCRRCRQKRARGHAHGDISGQSEDSERGTRNAD